MFRGWRTPNQKLLQQNWRFFNWCKRISPVLVSFRIDRCSIRKSWLHFQNLFYISLVMWCIHVLRLKHTNFHRNPSIWTKIEWTSIFCIGKNCAGYDFRGMVQLYLFHLFYHRFGRCSFRIGISNLVDESMHSSIGVHSNWIMTNIHVSNIWFPFHWRNPFGFLAALMLELVMLSTALKIGCCALILAIGVYFYTIAFSKCIKQNLFAIGQSCRFETEEELIR